MSGGKEQWKFSGELQFRVKDNFQQLDNWFIEGVGNYLPNQRWEIVPDMVVRRNFKGAWGDWAIAAKYQFGYVNVAANEKL